MKVSAGTVPPAAGTAGPATAGDGTAGDLTGAAVGCGLGATAPTAGTTASTVSLSSGGTYVVLSSYSVLSAKGLSCESTTGSVAVATVCVTLYSSMLGSAAPFADKDRPW